MKTVFSLIGLITACAAPLPSVPLLEAPLPGAAIARAEGFVLLEHRRAVVFGVNAASAQTSTESKRFASAKRSAARARMLPAVRAAELRHRLPAGLLDALIATESAYLPWALSRAGAAGLAQLMPGTAAELGVVNRFDPLQSIEGGARYLRRMLDRFGSVSLALAAYNAGPGSVLRTGGIPANGETEGYVAQVLRRWTGTHSN
jgi:soluble lytic murein transglycosylase-like protein